MSRTAKHEQLPLQNTQKNQPVFIIIGIHMPENIILQPYSHLCTFWLILVVAR